MPSSLPKSPELASCRSFVTQDPSRCVRRSHVFHTSFNWINWSAGMSINSSLSVRSSVESTSSCKANNSEVKSCSLIRSEYQIWITAEALSFPPAIREQEFLTWGFLSQTVVFPHLSSVTIALSGCNAIKSKVDKRVQFNADKTEKSQFAPWLSKKVERKFCRPITKSRKETPIKYVITFDIAFKTLPITW